jgi:hypothetical protein
MKKTKPNTIVSISVHLVHVFLHAVSYFVEGQASPTVRQTIIINNITN